MKVTKLLTLSVLLIGFVSSIHLIGTVPSASATILDEVQVSGKVQNLSKSVVTLKTKTGVIRIPRIFFNEKKRSLRPGQKVSTIVSLEDVVALNKRTKSRRR